ncbi:hypothetical protein CYMTET_20656 [Cymbomonas tetramitiformis]|uniref:Pentacotripeptide-repeat region of PRORP domain-containing protein n=1 Tax=Cymbomonas tetramitiformis TaxID=36881 RepID=A0AAE0G3V8_9CHLO|nr:hypothetical protein CYMTET_20656 [Cymbomonas tetramitiformis]
MGAVSQGVEADAVVYNVLIAAEEEPSRVHDLLEEMTRRGVAADEWTYTAALRCIARSSLSGARKVWEEMLAQGVKPSVHTWSAWIHAHVAADCVEDAAALATEARRVLGPTFAHGERRADRGDTAAPRGRMQIVPRGSQARPPPLFGERKAWRDMLNVALKAYAQAKDSREALKLLEEMELNDPPPDLISYNTALHACCKARDVKGAAAVLGKMEQRHVGPDRMTFSHMLDLAGLRRDREGLERTLAAMEVTEVAHDEVTWRYTVAAYVRCGEGGAAMQSTQRMVQEGHSPLMSLTEILLKSSDAALLIACERSSYVQLCGLLDDMAAAGFSPTPRTAARVIARAAVCYPLCEAVSIAAQLQRQHASGFPEESPLEAAGYASLHALVEAARATLAETAALPAGTADAALELTRLADAVAKPALDMEEQEEEEGRPRAVRTRAYNVALQLCTRCGDADAALEVYRRMESHGTVSAAPDRVLLDTADAVLMEAFAVPTTAQGREAGERSSAEALGDGALPVDPEELAVQLAAAGIRPKLKAVTGAIARLTADGSAPSASPINEMEAAPGARAGRSTSPGTGPNRGGAVGTGKAVESRAGGNDRLSGPQRPRRSPAVREGDGEGSAQPAKRRTVDGDMERLERAILLVEALPRLVGVQPDQYLYTRLMRACVNQGQFDRAWDIYRRMRSEGLEMTSATWITYINALHFSGGFAGQVDEILEAISQSGISINGRLVSTLEYACQQCGETDSLKAVMELASPKRIGAHFMD